MNILLTQVLRATTVVALVLMLGACQSSSPVEKSLHAVTFDEALRDCRMQQPGRINRRLSLRNDSPNVAACLRRNGFEVNGDTQTLVASL
jgi:hypothetical protein